MKRLQGYNVLFPMGWDAFGAPAEQYAIKNHIHPKDAVKENISNFKRQMQDLGFSFDWSREFSTTDPEYYKWTQWQFLQFYKHNMAYKDTIPVNWCPNCKTVLSNEDAAGGVCERCGSQVVQKEKSQWMLRMSDYAEDLLKGLDDTNFAEKVKLGQINWIGKSSGVEVDIDIVGGGSFSIFTTCIETIYGITFFVTLKVPTRLTCNTSSKSSFFILISNVSLVIPALFTNTSILPNCSITCLTIFSLSSKLETSP